MNVLVADDYPMIVEGCINVLVGEPSANHHSVVAKAYNCEDTNSAKKRFCKRVVDLFMEF